MKLNFNPSTFPSLFLCLNERGLQVNFHSAVVVLSSETSQKQEKLVEVFAFLENFHLQS